eukprot:11292035-Alexandrium_andersonii.AAC.1
MPTPRGARQAIATQIPVSRLHGSDPTSEATGGDTPIRQVRTLDTVTRTLHAHSGRAQVHSIGLAKWAAPPRSTHRNPPNTPRVRKHGMTCLVGPRPG